MEAEGWREGEGSPCLIWTVPQDLLPFSASSDSTSRGPSLGLNMQGEGHRLKRPFFFFLIPIKNEKTMLYFSTIWFYKADNIPY